MIESFAWMDLFDNPLFLALFNTPVPRVILKADAPHFTIAGYNDAYKAATYTERRDIKGLSIWDAYRPEKAGGDGGKLFRAALTEAALTNKTVNMPPFHYDIPAANPSKIALSWWAVEIMPVADETGKVVYLLTTTHNITDKILNRENIDAGIKREQQLGEELAATNEELQAINEELSKSQDNLLVLNFELEDRVERRTKSLKASEHRLNSMVMTTPIGMTILRGRGLVIEMANTRMLQIWNRTREEVTGKQLMDIFPELVDQPFPKMLAGVFDTGKTVAISEIEADIATKDGHVHLYVDFSYDPLFDASGQVEAIMATVINVTETVEARKKLEKSESEQQALNEELSAINEEMAAANEELITTNEEIAETQQTLVEMVNRLTESESRFRYLVNEAPVAIAVLTGQSLIVESANAMILKIWGKTDIIVGQALEKALPELKGQSFLQILDDVYTTGKPYFGYEAKVTLEHGGRLQEIYCDFIYQPLKDIDGETTSIMAVAVDVTEQVNVKKELLRAEEMLRFSIEAANVGTFVMNVNDGTFITSPRYKELFGFRPNDDVKYETSLQQIPEDHRAKVNAAVTKAVNDGDDYHMEHPTTGRYDNKLRWVKVLGRLSKDTERHTAYFSGVLIDITEQKQDEMRKNDFIGMVSHELKTPLTSLSAIVQMLNMKAQKNDDAFTGTALDKAYNQVKKMTNMINGFLNVSRLESGKILVEKQNFSLNDLLNDTIEETRLTESGHHIVFQNCLPITVNADRDKIGSVISNLLSNAIKYSPKGKTIEVTCAVVGDQAQVSVKDEGIGIKPQDMEKLFERYYRVQNAEIHTISGFGIGLYLSAEIIESHGGSVWVESEPGVGSTFHFSLMLAKY